MIGDHIFQTLNQNMWSYNETRSIKAEMVSAVFTALSPILSINRCSVNMFWRKKDSRIFRIGSMPEYLEYLAIPYTDLCKGRQSLGWEGFGGSKEQQKHNLTQIQTDEAARPSQPLAPGAKTGSWSHLQPANPTKTDHNMNWMTCKLEAELFPKTSCFGVPARGQRLTRRQQSAEQRHCQECALTCLTCVSISANYWSLVITLDTVLLSCDKNELDGWATAH